MYAHLKVRYSLALKMIKLGQIVKAFAKAKLFPEALIIAHSIESNVALREIACNAAHCGLITYAYEIREEISDYSLRDQVMGCIAAALADQGDYTSAHSAADQIESHHKVDALRAIASAQVRRGDDEEAVKSISLSYNQAENWENDLLSASIFRNIASAQAKAGLASQALQTAARINVLQYSHLPDIAAAFAEKGDKASFKKLLVECVNFEDTIHRVVGLIAKLYPDSAENIMELLLQKLDEKYQFSG